MLSDDIVTVDMFICKNDPPQIILDAWLRIKAALAESTNSSHNTGSPKLPCAKCGSLGVAICKKCFNEVIIETAKQAWQIRAGA